jgi:heterodisulfide reductase subunit A-like polyferredoxin
VQSVNLSPATHIIPGLVHDVWDQDKCQPKYPKLTSNEEADVVIIGGGIAGLSVAYNLVHDGKKVVVLERATIGEKGPTDGENDCEKWPFLAKNGLFF